MIFHDKTTKLWACRYGEMGNVDFNMLLIEVSTSFKHQTKFSHSIRRILNIFNGRRGGKCFFTEISFCDSSRNRFTWLRFALPMSMLCDQKVKWILNSIFLSRGKFRHLFNNYSGSGLLSGVFVVERNKCLFAAPSTAITFFHLYIDYRCSSKCHPFYSRYSPPLQQWL